MSRGSYRNFLRLLEKWPVDQTKSGGRDLGEHLRLRVTESFKHGDVTSVDEVECQRIYSSLSRIAKDTYAKQYPRSLSSTATGLSGEVCREIISNDFLKALEEQERGFFSRLFKRN
ncbi:ubiquinol-cytochrome c reductase complex assembly factor 2 [Panulirus ornatus]|uniref:ubiquinol-cytochrome c reductase complex assembly factor 2 n=1 Tax=Panulirus ornatus TaxID=150431 RepID=UPI003A8B2D43